MLITCLALNTYHAIREGYLSSHIKYKKEVWADIRKSYRQLQLLQKEFRELLGGSMNLAMLQEGRQDTFRLIVCHWSKINCWMV